MDLFILKYSSEGIKKWSNVLDFNVEDGGNEKVLDLSDDIYVIGNTFNLHNNKDILVVKLGSIPLPPQIPGYEIILLLVISNITLIILMSIVKKGKKLNIILKVN